MDLINRRTGKDAIKPRAPGLLGHSVNSSERYPNRVVSLIGLNRAYMKIRTPNSCCTDNTWFFEYFYGFLGFVVWEISGHFGGVYQSRYCASDCAFLFSFVYVMYQNIASYLCGKQIKSNLEKTMCLWIIFICVYLKRLGLIKCCTRTLKIITRLRNFVYANVIFITLSYGRNCLVSSWCVR